MPAAGPHYRYVIALGSNRRHHHYGRPRQVLQAALRRMENEGLAILAIAPVIETAAVGPSLRRYANSAAHIETNLPPDQLLGLLKMIEATFRRRSGQRWSARTLDLDVILWNEGIYTSSALSVPHRLFRTRDFVLQPLLSIVPKWIDPVTGLSIRQLFARLKKKHS